LPDEKYEFHYLDWIIPETKHESLENYVKRLGKNILHQNPVLIGVSFGGIIVQELSKIVQAKKIIIISSVKNKNEFPKRLKFLQVSKLYKLFPTKRISEINDFSKYNFTEYLEKKSNLYNKYMGVRNEKYLDWAIYNVLHWKSEDYFENVIHIHGSKDEIFPIKYIKNCIEIKDGNHAMIITKAKKINRILQEII
jgi:esterase/lipase